MKHFMNWQFEDIVQFLIQNHFEFSGAPGTSHHYYSGYVDGEERLVQVQFHAGKAIKPKTLKLTIIPHSGIPEQCWLEFAQLPPQKRKKYCYKGSEKLK